MKLIEKCTRASLLFAVASTGWLSGCSFSDTRRDLTTLQDSTATVDILESSATCGSCITVERIVALGDMIGPGYINWSRYVTIDDSGNYWVGQQQEGVVKVWDAEGRFVRQVGRSGDGPMEFHRPAPVRTDSEGRVHIVDLDIGRETVVNTDFSYSSDRSLHPGSYQLAVPLREDGRYLGNLSRMTAELVGLPLHIVDGSAIIYSFGMATGVSLLRDPLRVLTIDRRGRIYSAKPDDYLIQIWSESGRRILGLRGPTLNKKEALPGYWSPDNPPRNKIYAMQADAEQRLWVISFALKDDWKDHMEERVLPNGRIAYGPNDDDLRNIFQSRIDLIDLTSGSLIATGYHTPLLEAFVGPGVILENRSTERQYPQMIIWRLKVQHLPKG